MMRYAIAAALAISLLDTLAVLFIGNDALTVLACAVVTFGSVAVLYRVMTRGVKTVERQLDEAIEENMRVDNIRRTFVANVTHELNTPLTSISGFIETLQEGAAEDPEVRKKFLDIIAIETARLKRLIEDLLVLSEIENKKETAPEKLLLESAVSKTVNLMEPIAEKRGIRLLVDCEEGLAVEGSEDRLIQMMMNLIENAIKYSNEGGRVWIKTGRRDGRLFFSVRDEGIGIDRQHQERLFERFYRVDKSRSRKVGGTGLGLSIVKHIAVLFDAELALESEPGRGSTFTVLF
jgi:two-component system phosphate regulon sensor histidine kinase PhoR